MWIADALDKMLRDAPRIGTGRLKYATWHHCEVLSVIPVSLSSKVYTRLVVLVRTCNSSTQDLVICLWELTEGANYSDYNQPPQSGTSVKAEFVFGLMCPDAKVSMEACCWFRSHKILLLLSLHLQGRVDEAAFHAYVHSVFNLCGSKKDADESVTLGLPPGSLHHRVRYLRDFIFQDIHTVGAC